MRSNANSPKSSDVSIRSAWPFRISFTTAPFIGTLSHSITRPEIIALSGFLGSYRLSRAAFQQASPAQIKARGISLFISETRVIPDAPAFFHSGVVDPDVPKDARGP